VAGSGGATTRRSSGARAGSGRTGTSTNGSSGSLPKRGSAKGSSNGSGAAPAGRKTVKKKATAAKPTKAATASKTTRASTSAARGATATATVARTATTAPATGKKVSGKRGRSPVSSPVVVGTRRPIGGRAPAAWVERLFAPPNVDGPRVRTGLLWFVLAVPAVWFGAAVGPDEPLGHGRATALLFGLVAVVAALQGGQAWNRAGYHTNRFVGVAGTVVMVLAALTPRPAVAGIVLAAMTVAALVAAMATPRRRRRTSALGAAGATISAAAPGAIAAAGMVAVAGLGRPAALTLLVLVSAYELGSFVFGAESPYPSHGILGGAVCTMVAVAPIWVFRLQPFDGRIEVWVFGGLVAVLAPLGSVVASACLPTAATWVPALRRLDAYILAAPLWVSVMWAYLG
jgi:hypothetical protein